MDDWDELTDAEKYKSLKRISDIFDAAFEKKIAAGAPCPQAWVLTDGVLVGINTDQNL